METILVKIEGVTPLLTNRFTDEAQMKATSGQGSTLVGSKGSPRDIAESKLYTDDDGVIGIPQPNLFRAIIDAGKFLKAGKSKVTTQKTSLVPAGSGIQEIFIPIEHEQPWKVDTRPVRIPSTGGRILCHRPCFDDWRLTFHVAVDLSVFDLRTYRELLDMAGQRIGLGDFRPDCKGPFGKFKVVLWEQQKAAA